MTDWEHYRLRGPVRSVRFEWASIDPQTSDWEPLKQGPTITFDDDGWQQGRRNNEAPTITTVDENGRRRTVGPRGPSIARQPEMVYGIGMDSAIKFDVLTHYDAQDRPAEVIFRNEEQQALHRILLTYDADGRIAREQVLMGDVFGGGWGVSAEGAGPVDPPSAEQLEELFAESKKMMPDGVFTTLEYAYDSRGRLSRLMERMGLVSESRRSFTYDDHDNVLEEHYEGSHREADMDSDGNVVTSNESSDESWNRYEYRYDERGNFVEKVTLRREAPGRDFHRSNIERRTITYFDESPPLHISNSAIDQ